MGIVRSVIRMNTKVSAAGAKVLELLARGVDTPDGLEKATGRDPEDMARTLAALMRRGMVVRQFDRGEDALQTAWIVNPPGGGLRLESGWHAQRVGVGSSAIRDVARLGVVHGSGALNPVSLRGVKPGHG